MRPIKITHMMFIMKDLLMCSSRFKKSMVCSLVVGDLEKPGKQFQAKSKILKFCIINSVIEE